MSAFMGTSVAACRVMGAIFKALAKALDQATMLDERLAGKVLSTKGIL